MKKIGLIGGLGWPSTVEYYRKICEGVNAHFASLGHESPLPTPEIDIVSLNMANTVSLRGREGDSPSWVAFDNVFRSALQQLEATGSEVIAIASTTPHARLHAFADATEIPIVSILTETAVAVAGTGTRSALILGTEVTMKADALSGALRAHGVASNPILPETEIDLLQRMINEDFYRGSPSEARGELLAFCDRHSPAPGSAVVLGCTELPLAFPEHSNASVFETGGHLMINPVMVHVGAIIDRALD